MKRAATLAFMLLCTSCQLQINIASSVVNVPVVKIQKSGTSATMTGSKVEDIDSKQKASATVPVGG